MSGLQKSCKEVLQPAAGCIIILALSGTLTLPAGQLALDLPYTPSQDLQELKVELVDAMMLRPCLHPFFLF